MVCSVIIIVLYAVSTFFCWCYYLFYMERKSTYWIDFLFWSWIAIDVLAITIDLLLEKYFGIYSICVAAPFATIIVKVPFMIGYAILLLYRFTTILIRK